MKEIKEHVLDRLPTSKDAIQAIINNAPNGWSSVYISTEGEALYFFYDEERQILNGFDGESWINCEDGETPNTIFSKEFIINKFNAA